MTTSASPAAAFDTPPARKGSTPSNTRIKYGFHSAKTGSWQNNDSYLEFLTAMSCELNAAVIRYKAQPERISYTIVNGKSKWTTPDFMVDFGDSVKVFECKWERRAKRYEDRTKICKAYYAERGATYDIVTEKTIEFFHPYRHFNARMIFDRRMRKVPFDFGFRVSEAFAKGNPETLGDLTKLLGKSALDNLYKLHVDGYLFIDYFEHPLGNDTRVTKLKDFMG